MHIPATYYHPIYLFVVLMLTILYSIEQTYDRKSIIQGRYKTANYIPLLLISLFFIFFIGYRPNDRAFVDMVSYSSMYKKALDHTFYLNLNTDNVIFDNIIPYMASKNIPAKYFFLLISAVYFGGIAICCYKLFPRFPVLGMIVYLGAFSTFSYGVNGIKAGMAASIFLIALAYRNNLWISIPVALLTYTIHHSMSLVIVSYLIVVFLIKNQKWYFAFWIFCLVMALAHVTYFQTLFAGFTDEHGAEYLLSDINSGLRLDFILYSAVPVYIGYIIVFKYKKMKSRLYYDLLNLYLTTNGIWMLCMYSNFTNRISYLSWFLYPIVLLYPFINISWIKYQRRYINYVVWGHLAFTLFMVFVYYA